MQQRLSSSADQWFNFVTEGTSLSAKQLSPSRYSTSTQHCVLWDQDQALCTTPPSSSVVGHHIFDLSAQSQPVFSGALSCVQDTIGSDAVGMRPSNRESMSRIRACEDIVFCATRGEESCPSQIVIGRHDDGARELAAETIGLWMV